MPEWLEQELAREIAPVEAPDELWCRIQMGRVAVVSPRRRSPALLVAAAAMVLVTAGAIWLWGSPVRTGTATPSAQGSCYMCHTSL